MKLQDVKDVSKERILNMMGLEVKSPVRTWLSASGILGIGLLVGAGLAMLLTPKSGRQMREKLAKGLRVLPFVR